MLEENLTEDCGGNCFAEKQLEFGKSRGKAASSAVEDLLIRACGFISRVSVQAGWYEYGKHMSECFWAAYGAGGLRHATRLVWKVQ